MKKTNQGGKNSFQLDTLEQGELPAAGGSSALNDRGLTLEKRNKAASRTGGVAEMHQREKFIAGSTFAGNTSRQSGVKKGVSPVKIWPRAAS